MHYEVLAEGGSGSVALDCIMEKILGENGSAHSWRIRGYKGVGRIPEDLRGVTDPGKRILLDRLPRLLRGYGRSLKDIGDLAAVVVVADLDDRDCMAFKRELLDVLNACNPRPRRTLFRIAIEESEAWLQGDRDAVKAAYPDAKDPVQDRYVQDDVCGTWEVLADAVHPGGFAPLEASGHPATGAAKCEWAESIAPHPDVDRNRSRSFQVFRDGVATLARAGDRSTDRLGGRRREVFRTAVTHHRTPGRLRRQTPYLRKGFSCYAN